MAPHTLQPYSSTTFSNAFTQIYRLIHALDCIRKFTKPCEPCMIHLLHEIASHLNFLLTIGPSENIAEELTDMHHLTKLSRQLLELDWLGFTSAVWTLVDRKLSSLYDTRLALPPMSNSWNESRVEAGRDGFLAEQKSRRRRRRQGREVNLVERRGNGRMQQPSSSRALVSDFEVIEGDSDQLVRDPRRPPRRAFSSFDVVEREPHRQVQEPTARRFHSNMVESTAPGQTQQQNAPSPRSSSLNTANPPQPQHPRSLASDFAVVERSTTTQPIQEPIPRPSNIDRDIHTEPPAPEAPSSSDSNVIERTPSRQPSLPGRLTTNTLPPSVVERLLGSLGGIIAALEEDDDADAAGNEGGASAQQGPSTV
ncbi:MAG: hypothetical protein LQ346_008709 [Caloplaca aetnensis]|nr:MAG: hypothetical protein LQ346_008709 [Caloplaca aetnensis]